MKKYILLLIIPLIMSGCAGIGWQKTTVLQDRQDLDYHLETAATYKMRAFIALTGGTTGALDAIDSTNLNDLDSALVVTGSNVYFYSYDEDSAESESSPDVIVPDDAPAAGRWILLSSIMTGLTLAAADNPTIKYDELTGTDWWVGTDDAGNEREWRTHATVGTNVRMQLTETGVLYVSGNVNGLDDINATNDINSGGVLFLSQTPQTLSGAGAINNTTSVTEFTSTGGDALTIANGQTECQIKFIVHISDGGAGTLSGANIAGANNPNATVIFTDEGDSCTLLYTNALWYVVGGNALYTP